MWRITEVVKAVSGWTSKQLGVKKVGVENDNIASKAVLEKAGFYQNGVIGIEALQYVFVKNGLHNTKLYETYIIQKTLKNKSNIFCF